ncbi:MAG: AAA family ATPase [Proteobacteria bacterium]|nr:AAA family ATPase [Pseudomonadota bacterium]
MSEDSQLFDQLPKKLDQLRSEIAKAVIGQNKVIEEMLIALLSGGNCLFVGVPGLAKTLLINTVAKGVGLDFGRIQFTPDLLPADITGGEILQEDRATGRRELRFVKGPVFTNLLLADEINRTPPKTQAALLQAMQEKVVTAGGHTYKLDPPFLVFATQNPIEQEGTYPLPEAQLDRFMFSILVEYPTQEEEVEIIERTTQGTEVLINPVLSKGDLLNIQRILRQVPVARDINQYAASLARATRPTDGCLDFIKEFVHWGAGPRASQFLSIGARVRAGMQGRETATKSDVQSVAKSILRHRIVRSFQAQAAGVSTDQIIDRLIEQLN